MPEFLKKNPSAAWKFNLIGTNKENDNSITRFKVGNLLYLRKRRKKLKSDGGLTTKPPIVDWYGGEIAIEVHWGAGEIITKNGSKAKIGVCGLIRMDVNAENKRRRLFRWGANSMAYR